jgi:hypothetical protein
MGLWDKFTGAVSGATQAIGLGDPLSTLSGGIGGVKNPLASPNNAAAARGTPRAGTGPDRNNYSLGGDPNYNAQFQQNQGAIAQQGQGLSQNAQAIGNQGAGIMGAGYSQGQGLTNMGTAAAGRGGPTTSYNPQVGQLQQGSQQAGQQQYQLANQLQTMAGQPQGPSAAQAQLNTGTDQALNSQLAMARSGSGFGESSGAMASAQQNAAGIQSNAANQAGMLRAGEDQAHRARQLQALGMSGDALGQGRAADLALGQQQIGQGQFGTQTELSQRQMNDSAQQNLINSGLQAQNMGLSAGLQAQNMGLSGQAAGINAQNQANQLALASAEAEQQGGMNYEQNVTDIYGMDQGAHDRARELNQKRSNDWVGGITGGIGAIGSLAAMSDRRSKKNIETEDLSRVYRALGGK